MLNFKRFLNIDFIVLVMLSFLNVYEYSRLFLQGENVVQVMVRHNYFWMSLFIYFNFVLLKKVFTIKKLKVFLMVRVGKEAYLKDAFQKIILFLLVLLLVHFMPALFFILKAEVGYLAMYFLVLFLVFLFDALLLLLCIETDHKIAEIIFLVVPLIFPICIHFLLLFII